MIPATMAVAAVTPGRSGLAGQARDARFPRLVALILDTIFVGVISSVADAVYGVTVVTWGSPAMTAGYAMYGSQTVVPWAGTMAIWLSYYIVFEAVFGATPGKLMNGVRVIAIDGGPLPFRAVVVRNVLRLIDALPAMYLVGGVVLLATVNSQRVGDRWAGTTVVTRPYAAARGAERHPSRSVVRLFWAGVIVLAVITALFDYFGRPPLVVQGEYNQHELLSQTDIITYALGQPTRTLDAITYPITARTPTQRCTGSLTLTWQGLGGWTEAGGRLECFPS